jgi:hypothetical protein
MEAVCSFETLVSTYKSIRVTIQKALIFPLPLAPQKSYVFILLVDFVKKHSPNPPKAGLVLRALITQETKLSNLR